MTVYNSLNGTGSQRDPVTVPSHQPVSGRMEIHPRAL